MKLSRNVIITILCIIAYIAVGYASQWSAISLPTRYMLMSLQLIIAGAAVLALIIYACRSTWKNRRLESFLLLILSIFIGSFLIPIYTRMSYHFAHLAFQSTSANVNNSQNQQEPGIITQLTTKDSYNQFITANNDTLVVIKASAVWCPPCQLLKPIYQEVAAELGDIIKCAEIDVDSFEDRSAIAVHSLPTLLLYKNGHEISRIVGFKSKVDLMSELQKFI